MKKTKKEENKKRNSSASRDPPKPWSKDLKYVRKQIWNIFASARLGENIVKFKTI